jgi:hypothetical protein
MTSPVITELTPQDFKDLFKRGFNYLPVWSAEETYNIGDVVYYEINSKFYTCKDDGVTSVPTTTADWDILVDNVLNYVSDDDITEAYSEALIVFNEALFDNDIALKKGYLYLSAHFLVGDLNMGGAQSVATGLVQSRSVGSISESYVVPDWAKSPFFSDYSKTSYGMKYLTMVRPKLVGNTASVYGGTNP